MKVPKKVYIGILAGGSGERLWPLSNEDKPKQLLSFINNKSLLEQTIDRLTSHPDIVENNIFILTVEHQQALIKKAIPHFAGFFIVEPASRNTAPALLLACRQLVLKDPSALVIFLPADHFIPDQKAFHESLSKMIEAAQSSQDILLLGVRPSFPATGYGYIELEEGDGALVPVKKFHEKPSAEIAREYYKSECFLWNLGIFGGNVTSFLYQFDKYCPELVTLMDAYDAQACLYNDMPKISVDYALMEKTREIRAVKACFEWYDVGSLHAFLAIQDRYGAARSDRSPHIISSKGAGNMALIDKKLVIFVGMSNVSVIETNDVLVILQAEHAEDIKHVIGQAKSILFSS